MKTTVKPGRVKHLNKHYIGEGESNGPVIYWMSRNQRAGDNWALFYAQELALELRRPLVAVFFLSPIFGEARDSHYRFMLTGLKETAGGLEKKGIPFFLFGPENTPSAGKPGSAPGILTEAVEAFSGSALVMDFDPVKIKRRWNESAAKLLSIPACEVDGRNVVPLWEASDKQEYAARTIRPKILKALPEYLEEFPKLRKHPYSLSENDRKEAFGKIGKYLLSWEKAEKFAGKLKTGPDLSWIDPGPKAAEKRLADFIHDTLKRYAEDRNDPNKGATSMLSPYLHFGQLAAARAALEADRAAKEIDGLWEAADAFIEELVVRRELADNYCYYNKDYDSVTGFPLWGMKTLNKHRYDDRPYIYTGEQLEAGETHDDLWNTAQKRLTEKGTMHGFLRMYWAKKIVEWTKTPEEAMEYCLYFNDAYQLDGRDPNGYTGIAWAVGGVHDRPWKEREVFGTIRYMNYKGCKRKFDVDAYIRRGR